MSLATLAILLSGAGVLVTGWLALIFWRDPIKGLEQTTHRAENLPEVMTDRYIAFTLLALGATIYGDMMVIVVLFAVFAFMAFYDAWIYARAGHSITKHVSAGVAASLVVVVAGLALATQAEGG